MKSLKNFKSSKIQNPQSVKGGNRIKVVGTDNSSYEITTDENGSFNWE